MSANLLPAIIALAGLGTGVGTGIALRPDAARPIVEHAAAPCGIPADGAEAQKASAADHASAGEDAAGAHATEPAERAAPKAQSTPASHAAPAKGGYGGAATEFVKIDNQFIVPVIENGRVAAMVVLSVTLEVATGQSEGTNARLPKLRDRFLRTMLDHANVGGFSGTFTADGSVEQLRRNLMEAGRKELGDVLSDVLILDMNRQSV